MAADDVDKKYICSVCYEVLKQPILTPCSHSKETFLNSYQKTVELSAQSEPLAEF
jgi:hypothetical protein